MMKNNPLPFTQVKIQDHFWSRRMATNRNRGLDAVYQQLKKTGRIAAYDLEWTPNSRLPKPHVFWDSDVAKWLEGACYSLMNDPNPFLMKKVTDIVDRILSAQGDNGYLNPHYTVVEPEKRWTNLRDKHELYCAGHLIEAAIAHHRATGDPRFLHAMQRYADLIDQVFGPHPGQKHGYPGHEEIELALMKLYRHTKEKRYLKLAHFFVEERGRSPHYFDNEAQQRGEKPVDYWAKTHTYTQSHKPIREQREVVGHAVRAMYLYAGMTDLAVELKDDSLAEVLKILWEDLTAHKLYITGGIGPSGANEGFTSRFDLPNENAYAETCAAIGLIFWAHRMLQLSLNSRYADVLERALYNGMLGGVSLQGDRFFYVNPLASDGTHHRQPFYACSCCPPNINRILPTIGEYIYSFTAAEIAIHLYVQSEADFTLKAGGVKLIQETDYPWDGIVCVRLDNNQPVKFSLNFRKPGWCREYNIYLNDENITHLIELKHGYFSVSRTWQPDDELRLQWAMPATRVYAHPDVKADIGRTALMRGPLVYCFEETDQPVPVRFLSLARKTGFDSRFEPGLLDGVVTIRGTAEAVDLSDWGQSLYRPHPPVFNKGPIKAVPYYAWDNRQAGEMQVWLPETIENSG